MAKVKSSTPKNVSSKTEKPSSERGGNNPPKTPAVPKEKQKKS